MTSQLFAFVLLANARPTARRYSQMPSQPPGLGPVGNLRRTRAAAPAAGRDTTISMHFPMLPIVMGVGTRLVSDLINR